MTLRIITVDNSIEIDPQCEQTTERDSNSNTRTNISPPRKQNTNPSQNNRKTLLQILQQNVLKYLNNG